MADVNVTFEGWDSITQGWGDGTWGEDVAFMGLAGAVGSVTVTQGSGVTVTLSGNSAGATAGNVTVTDGTGVSVGVTGESATVSTSGVTVWGNITPSQSPSWSGVTVSQSPSWATVSVSQSPNWTDLAA